MYEEIQSLLDQLDSATSDATALAAGLSEAEAGMRMSPASWSIAQCIDHLARTNNLYLEEMQKAAVKARERGRLRRRPARPGFFGRWFAGKIEPPIRPNFRIKAIAKLQPEADTRLDEAFTAFIASQQMVHRFIHNVADLELASIRYANPIVKGMNFSLASGLHIVLAHERRHLWQAWAVRNAIKPMSSPSASTQLSSVSEGAVTI